MILSFRTDLSGQIVQTQIRVHLEEQSDQGLHYLQYCLHLLDALLDEKNSFSSFRMITTKFPSVPKFRNFTVGLISSLFSRSKILDIGFESHQGRRVVSLSKTLLHCLVLVQPRKTSPHD